jgi:hypothetical protein
MHRVDGQVLAAGQVRSGGLGAQQIVFRGGTADLDLHVGEAKVGKARGTGALTDLPSCRPKT